MVHHGEKFTLLGSTTTDEQKITHLVVRLYGALVTAQVGWVSVLLYVDREFDFSDPVAGGTTHS